MIDPSLVLFSYRQPRTPPPTLTLGASPKSGALGELGLNVVLGIGMVYLAVIVLVAAPIRLSLLSRYGPYSRVKDSLIPPAVGLVVHILSSLVLGVDGRLFLLGTVLFFLPAALILSHGVSPPPDSQLSELCMCSEPSANAGLHCLMSRQAPDPDTVRVRRPRRQLLSDDISHKSGDYPVLSCV